MAKKPKLPKINKNNKKNKDEKKLKVPKEREKKSGFLKNVFKSVRYSVHDIRSELTPNINSAIESGKQAVSEMYSMGKDDFKFDIKDLKNNEIVKTSKDLIKNMFSDLKSGKFYNKERAEIGENEAVKSFGIDIDMSFLDDDDNFDFGDDDSSESSSNDDFDFDDDSSDESSSGDTNIDNSKTFNTTNHNNFVTIQSNESSTVQALGVVSKSQIESSAAGFSAVSGILNNLYNFQQQNTLKFYNEMSEKMATITNALTGLNEMKEASNKMEAIREKEDKAGELLSIVGDFSFNYYTTQIKKKMEENDAKSLMENITGMLKMGASNPLGIVLKGAINKLIPKNIKDSLTSIDNLVGYLPLLLNQRMKDFSKKDGILGKIGSIFTDLFGVDIKANTKLDLSTNNKTEPFDTYTKKAITEVIPSYLSKIYSAISGQEEMVFNYQKGHFMTQKEIKEGFEQKVGNIPLQNSDTKEALDKMQEIYFSSNKGKNYSGEEIQKISEELKGIIQNMMTSEDLASSLVDKNQLLQFTNGTIGADGKKQLTSESAAALDLLKSTLSKNAGDTFGISQDQIFELRRLLDNGTSRSKKDINDLMQSATIDPTVSAAFNGRSELVKYYDPKDDEKKKKENKNFKDKLKNIILEENRDSSYYENKSNELGSDEKVYKRMLSYGYKVVGSLKKLSEGIDKKVTPIVEKGKNKIYSGITNMGYDNGNFDDIVDSTKIIKEESKFGIKMNLDSKFREAKKLFRDLRKEGKSLSEIKEEFKNKGLEEYFKKVVTYEKKGHIIKKEKKKIKSSLTGETKFKNFEDETEIGSSSLSEGIQSNYKRKNESSKTLGFIDYLSYFKEQEEKQGIGVFIKSFDKSFFDKNFINVIPKNEASIKDNGDETYSGKYKQDGKKITFQNAPKYDPENPNSEAQYTVEDNGDGTFTLHLKNGETIKGRAYAEGSELINENQLALIHKGESVLTENETSTIVDLGTEVAIINDKMDFLSQILVAVTSIRSDLLKWFNGEVPDGSNDENPTLDSDSTTKHTGIFSKIKSKFKVAGNKFKKFFTSKFKKKNNAKEEMAEEDAENADAEAKAKEASDKADERNKTKFAKYTEKFAEMMKDLKDGNFFKKLTESGGKLASALEGIKNIGTGLKNGGIAAKNFLIGKKNEDGTYKDGILTKAGKGLFGSKNADGTKKQGLLSKIVRGDKSKDAERGGKGGIAGALSKAKTGLFGGKDKDGNKKEGALGKARKTLFGKKDKDGKDGVFTKAATKVKDSKIGKKLFGDKATGTKGVFGKAKDKVSSLFGIKKDKGMDLSFIPSGVTPVWIVGSGTKKKDSPVDGAADAAKEKAEEAKEEAKEKAKEKIKENKEKLKEKAKNIAHNAKIRAMKIAHETKDLALKIAHTTKEIAIDTAHKAKERVKDTISNLKQRLTRETAVATEAGIEITETATREQKKTGIALIAEKMKGKIGKFGSVLGTIIGGIGDGIKAAATAIGGVPAVGIPLAIGVGAAGLATIAGISAAMINKMKGIDYSADDLKEDVGGGGDSGSGAAVGGTSETDKASKNADKVAEKRLKKEFGYDKESKAEPSKSSSNDDNKKESSKENSNYINKSKTGELDNEEAAKMLENIINMTPFGMAHNLGRVYNKFMSSDAGKQLQKNPKEFSKNMFALSTAGMLFNGFGGNYETGSKSLKSFFGEMGRKVNETFKELGENIKKLLGKNEGENESTEEMSDSEIVDSEGKALTGSSLETAKSLGLTEDDITSSGLMKTYTEKYGIKDDGKSNKIIDLSKYKNGRTYSKYKDGYTRLEIYDSAKKKNYEFRILGTDEEEDIIQDTKTGNLYYKEEDGNYYGYDENDNGVAIILRKNVATRKKIETKSTSSSSKTSTASTASTSGSAKGGSNDRNTFIKTALSIVGYTQDQILSHFGCSNIDWCAATVSYVFDVCGFIGKYVDAVHLGAGDIPRYSDGKYGTYYTCNTNYMNSGDIRPEPEAGDVILFKPTVTPTDKYFSSHVGIIVEVNGNTITTVEGNSDPYYVIKKTYDKNSDRINGYYRPNWVITSSGSSSGSKVNATQYLKDLSETISGWEAEYNQVGNDVDGVVSLGRYGYHANNALKILQSIQAKDPEGVSSILRKHNMPSNFLSYDYADWNNLSINDKQKSVIEDILNLKASKEIQDQKVIDDARSYVQDIESKYDIHDAGLLGMLADVRNQYGPAGLEWYWLDNMSKPYTVDGYLNYVNNNGLQVGGYKDRRLSVYEKMKKYIGKSPAYKQGTAWVPDTQVALLHEGEMVIPKEKNPLNPNKFENSEEIRKIMSGKGVSDLKKKETKEIIEKYANLKLIVENFEKLNNISEESLKILQKISNNIEEIKENKNNINNVDEYNFNLSSNSLNQLLQGY